MQLLAQEPSQVRPHSSLIAVAQQLGVEGLTHEEHGPNRLAHRGIGAWKRDPRGLFADRARGPHFAFPGASFLRSRQAPYNHPSDGPMDCG
jgi:hypothetical protein